MFLYLAVSFIYLLPQVTYLNYPMQVSPSSRERYRAVHLGVPVIMAEFKTVYKNEVGEVVDTRTYSMDLNSGEDEKNGMDDYHPCVVQDPP